jgi:hypothetical protein
MTSFTWKKKNQEIKINTLKELLEILIGISLEDIDQEIKTNIIDANIISWLENNFPKELILTTSLKNILKEYTPQQIREMLIRELQKK